MCKVIHENETRGAIIDGELNRDDCDEEDVRQFLKLLKRPIGLIPDK